MAVSEKVIKRLAHMGINEATLYAVQVAQSETEPMKVLDELWERSRGAFDYSAALEGLEDERSERVPGRW